MQLPVEYQNLFKTGALEEVVQTPSALALQACARFADRYSPANHNSGDPAC